MIQIFDNNIAHGESSSSLPHEDPNNKSSTLQRCYNEQISILKMTQGCESAIKF